MKLPEDPALQEWFKTHGIDDQFIDLDKKDRVLFAMIILLAGRIEQDFRRLKTLLAVTIIICLVNVIIIL